MIHPVLFLPEGYEFPENDVLHGRNWPVYDGFAKLERDPVYDEKRFPFEPPQPVEWEGTRFFEGDFEDEWSMFDSAEILLDILPDVL